MSWYDNVFLAEPDYFEDTENPAVLERCITNFQENVFFERFAEFDDGNYINLLMKVATNHPIDESKTIQSFITMIRSFYEKELNAFIDDNYVEEYDKWLEHERAI